MEKYIVNEQWKAFVKRCGLTEQQLPPDQHREMKRSFFGAWGQLLILMRDDLAELPEEDGVKELEKMLKEVGDYWINETKN